MTLFFTNLFDKIQLTLLYSYTFYNLLSTLLHTIFSLDYTFTYLTFFEKYIPKSFFTMKYFTLKPNSNTNNMYLLSYIILDTLVINPKFNFSLIVKYNILLVIALMILKNLILNYWQILFFLPLPINQTTTFLRNTSIDPIIPFSLFALINILQIYVFFFVLYFMAYIKAINGTYLKISYLNWLFDSIAFWLKIKTSTIKY